MSDVNFDEIEQRNLQKLIDMEKPDVFGVSFVKRNLILGQDRAESLIDRGIEEGKLVEAAVDSWEKNYSLK